jgi:YidC/Oxa1 family membrane protein insertase
MKRQDYAIFFLLVGLLFAWPGIYQKYFAEKKLPLNPAVEQSESTNAVDEEINQPVKSAKQDVVADPAPVEAASVVETQEAQPLSEAILVELTNNLVKMVVSSHGATLVNASLTNYRESLPEDSPPVSFDFSGHPALEYSGIPGLSAKNDFTVESKSGERVVLSRHVENGLVLRREIALGDDYLINVTDTFDNESDSSLDIGQHLIRTGTIPQEHAHEELVGMINMGVDSQPPAGGVENWGKSIPGQFKVAREENDLPALPEEINFKPSPKPANWVAAKNKYFVQILMPDGDGADWIEIYARRHVSDSERAGARVKNASVDAVAASLGFNTQTLAPGEEYVRKYEFYVGPKNYGILSKLSYDREGAMGFEENSYLDFIVVPTAKLLLRLLIFIHNHVFASYGMAIILLTLIVKTVFWPITHKGTESMRRMASVQPLMAEVREKYKDNPQKMQQAIMALYKEHKINPLGGCLPMFVQIPVFFALFVVLRIAIELRFAEFLWIKDLSAPERLIEFGFAIPLLGWDALNVLPLLMTITMIFQMKLSPAAGDPQQQKIMQVMMPAMMLFFLYNFASGLALYWTTQNVLMILQQLIYQQRKKVKEAVAATA